MHFPQVKMIFSIVLFIMQCNTIPAYRSSRRYPEYYKMPVFFKYDYCNPGLCPDGKEHVACPIPDVPETCMPSFKVHSFTDAQKSKIVRFHNRNRNWIALGFEKRGDPGPMKSAKAMNYVNWDEELAYLATLNVKRCRYGVDECHNTNRFVHSGQNVGMRMSSLERTDPSSWIDTCLTEWYEEVIVTPNSLIGKFGEVVGETQPVNFAQMVVSNVTKVGCAISQYVEYSNESNKFEDVILMTCNYDVGLVEGSPLYVTGQPATGCGANRMKPNLMYSGLCGQDDEEYHKIRVIVSGGSCNGRGGLYMYIVSSFLIPVFYFVYGCL